MNKEIEYNGDFKNDVKLSDRKTMRILEDWGWRYQWNYDKRFDFIYGGKKFEAKDDMRALETGNIFVEFKNWWTRTASGIDTTEADFYMFIVGKECLFIKTFDLKKLIDNEQYKDIKTNIKNVGDGFIFDLNVIRNYSVNVKITS